MADEVKSAVDAAAETAKAGTEASTATAKAAAKNSARASKRVAEANSATTKKAARRATANRTNAKRRTARTARKPEAAVNERNNDVKFDSNSWFAGFSIPAAAPFQSLFAGAGERGQEAVRRSQQAAEELADLTRENVEALVEAGRIAAEGARSIGEELVESSRESIEQAADAVRALAEAKSPTEFVQLQGEFARASFDRLVSESSRLTESFVKLAGEAFQPISTRASVNAERLNQFVA